MTGQALARVVRRGFEAARRGEVLADCPYLAANNRDAWAQGFADGLREASRRAPAAWCRDDSEMRA